MEVDTDIYVELSDRNNLVRFNSHHPKAMLGSLPYKQLLCVKRIVKDPSKIAPKLDEICETFQKRGYPKTLLVEHRKMVESISRDTLLTYKKKKDKEKRLTFVSTYSSLSDKINKVIKKEWHILGDALPQIMEFKNLPRMAYKRCRIIKDQLCKADMGPEKKLIQTTLNEKRMGCYPLLTMQ